MSNCKCQCLKALAIRWSCGNFCDSFFKLSKIVKLEQPFSVAVKMLPYGRSGRMRHTYETAREMMALLGLGSACPLLKGFSASWAINPSTKCNPDQSVISLSLSIHRLTSRLSAAQEQALLSTDGLWRQPASCFCVAFLGARHTAKAPRIYFFCVRTNKQESPKVICFLLC